MSYHPRDHVRWNGSRKHKPSGGLRWRDIDRGATKVFMAGRSVWPSTPNFGGFFQDRSGQSLMEAFKGWCGDMAMAFTYCLLLIVVNVAWIFFLCWFFFS
jgi:hypothetical protein